ncbi:MAG TPA: MFS transporter [candidate division Zixibacteria bacterium]|nr:MFS transporter [candidate division Zixibacteria bacterium]
MPLVPASVRARLRGIRLLEPLRERDFALLTGGAFVSLLGDGFFSVALAWQVYQISNVPTALSVVGVAWTLPLVLFLLLGGVFTDRYDRRLLMIGADIVRAAAIGLMGILSVADAIQLWHIMVLIAFVGIGDAFFNPASTAMVPDLLPEEKLPQANALNGLVRPLTVRLAGPAIGGFVIAVAGPGAAFLVDGASFLLSAAAIAAIRARPAVGAVAHGVRQTLVEVREGLVFVLANPWCWATLVAAMLSLLVFIGPMQVLLPYLVKNRLGLGPEALGSIFAVGGVGSVLAAIWVGQRGLPRLRITAMYACWSIGVAMFVGYGIMDSLWHAFVVAFATAAFFEVGQIIWITLLQTLVPRRLLGRVVSLDWLMSTGLVPVSFALTGPVSAALGPGTTMIAAGLIGAFVMGALLFVPGVRDPERGPHPAALGGGDGRLVAAPEVEVRK